MVGEVEAGVKDWGAERVWVTGGHGFLGNYVLRALQSAGAREVRAPTHGELDLLDRGAVLAELEATRPTVVLHLAAEVGGIGANAAHPGRFAYANLVMGAELLEGCRRTEVRRTVVVSTTCTYPADAPVPLHPRDWWEGYPAAETAPYGLAKKMLFVLAEGYRREYGLDSSHLIPANLYGPGDHIEEERSHVVPALIRRFLEAVSSGADEVVCWGTGRPTREFLYVEDAARAVLLAAERDPGGEPLQVGSGEEISIEELTGLVAHATGFAGKIRFDASHPDGHLRRCLDSSRAGGLGFSPRVDLREGVARTVEWMRGALGRADSGR